MTEKAKTTANQPALLNPEMVKYVKESGRLTDLAYDAILDAIATRRIKPGQQIKEETLTKELQVSRATIRSALSKLVVEGLLIEEPFKGVRVPAITSEDVKEIFELRGLLEGRAMELAAKRISDADLARMKELLPSTALKKDASRIRAVRRSNHEFHWIAIRACGQDILIRHLELLWGVMATYVLIDQLSPLEFDDVATVDYAGHKALVEALVARDSARARQVIEAASRETASAVLKHPAAAITLSTPDH